MYQWESKKKEKNVIIIMNIKNNGHKREYVQNILGSRNDNFALSFMLIVYINIYKEHWDISSDIVIGSKIILKKYYTKKKMEV